MNVRAWSSGAAVLTSVLCGCAGGAGTDPSSSPSPCIAYGTLPQPPVMLFPENGATAVPDGNFVLVMSRQYGTRLDLDEGGTIAIQALTAVPVPSPLPSPSATAPPNSKPVAYAVPALHANTTYTVVGHFAIPNGCSTYDTPVGSFTTQ